MILARLNVSYPMMFSIENEASEKVTHCGVLEFSAPEGIIYLPHWAMKTIGVRSGDFVTLRNVSLRLGSFVKLQPQSVAFLDITDPRAVLEHSFRAFSALTRGDIIQISYNDDIYELLIMEVKPEGPKHAVSIVETDLQVDFAPPVGYVEPTPQPKVEKSIAGSLGALNMSSISSGAGSPLPSPATSSFKAFSGARNRLKSSTSAEPTNVVASPASTASSGPSALRLPPGMLFFGQQKPAKPPGEDEKPPVPSFKAFGGTANKLR